MMTITMMLLVCIYMFKSLRACVLPTNLWQGNYWSVLTLCHFQRCFPPLFLRTWLLH
uniref:Uncharacterized protein n=1 Tax=Anguilla anguilla TaxID=7936 RepID=A0A0E9TH74_ANGAN